MALNQNIQNGLIIFALAAKSARVHLNFRFCIQIPHGFSNRVILLQNKTKYGLVGTQGLMVLRVISGAHGPYLVAFLKIHN